MIAFYQWMMPRLSETMAVLHDLTAASTKDRRKLVWTSQHTSAFQEALKKLSNITEMTRPEASLKFILCTDASDRAVGASLNHESEDKLLPIAFFSIKLTSRETKYLTFNRKLFALMLEIKHFRHHIEGGETEVRTDHKPLLFAQQMNEPSNRQWR